MKALETGGSARRVSREGVRVMLPLVALSLLAIGVYSMVHSLGIEDLGRNALFDVVMAFVAPGIAGLFGFVGGLFPKRQGEWESEGFCFFGAVIGAVVFFVSMLT